MSNPTLPALALALGLLLPAAPRAGEAAAAPTGPPPGTAPTAAAGGTGPAVADILTRFAAEPTILEVQRQAMHYAEVHPDLIASWRARAANQAWLPVLTMTVDQDRKRNEDWGVGGGSVTSPGLDDYGRGADKNLSLTLRAQWDLPELVFHGDELRVSNEATDLVQLREDVLGEVTKLYFARRRLQAELFVKPPSGLMGRLEKELRLQELTADIDALTGGWFSAELARRAAQEGR